MLRRILYLLSCFCVLWVFFLLQKPFFMLADALKSYSFTDYLQVIWHGASLDATTAAYLTVIPFLIVFISVWYRHFPFRKVIVPYYILITLLVALIYFGDMALYSFWGTKLDATVFLYLDSPKEALASVSGAYVFWRIVGILLLTAFMTAVLYLVTPVKMPKINMLGSQLLSTLWVIPLGGLLFLVIRGGVRQSTANVGDAYFSEDQFLNQAAVNPAFSLFSSMGKQKKFEDEFNFFDEQERNKLMEGMYPKGNVGTKYVLTTNRPNILVVLMESFGGMYIKELGGNPDVAPHLNALAQEGVFFSRCFANSFRTDRGMVCTFSGYPGLPTLSVMKVPALSESMPNLAASLSKEGYTTDFLYGGDINFTNMKGYLRNGGFQKIVSEDDFSMAQRNDSKWGVNDGVTFDYLYNELKKRPLGKPWFTAFLTLSSHEPFEVPYHRLADKEYNAFAYTDECIGKFIERFRKLPQWKNTLIVFLPDHGHYYPKEGDSRSPRFFRIPIIWTGGAVRYPMEFKKIMNQADLSATLLAQLGISHKDYPFSRNVLSEAYIHPFAFYAFNNGFGFCDNTGASVYDNNTNKVVYELYPNEMRVKKGKAILQTLYDDLGKRSNKFKFIKK